MADEDSGPFTEADLEEMNVQLQALERAERLINRSARAGIDVSSMKAQADDIRLQLNKLKTAFFPGR